MGCGGCVKKKVFLKAKPEGIKPELVKIIIEYQHQKVKVLDLTGQQTIGKLRGVEISHIDEATSLEDGCVAVDTLLGTSIIGFNIIESIELLANNQSSITS